MTDEIKQKPTFIQCLIHETKFAYVPYLQWLAVFTVFILIVFGIYVGVLSFPYEQVGQYLKLLPWYVYAILLILSPPCIYSCIECTRRRVDKQSVQSSGMVLIIIACILAAFGFGLVVFSLVVMAVICGIVGFWLL